MKRQIRLQTVLKTNEDVPDYALSYLVNGDDSGLEDRDQATIDTWYEQYQDLADMRGGNVIISPGDEHGEFTNRPAFGLACSTTPTTILILAPPLPSKGTLERRIFDMLATHTPGTLFDVVAYELTHDGEGWSVNTPFHIGTSCTVPEVLTHARARFGVFKVNYSPRARVNTLEDINQCGGPDIALDCEEIPFLEIRPCEA